MPSRYLSLEEANAKLPKLIPILGRAMQLHAHLRPLTEELLEAGVHLTPSLLAGEAELRGDDHLQRLCMHARALVDALRDEIEAAEAIGAEIKDLEQGLVDFPSLMGGREAILLCWRLGEPSIRHFHALDTGFASRQPIDDREFVGRDLQAG